MGKYYLTKKCFNENEIKSLGKHIMFTLDHSDYYITEYPINELLSSKNYRPEFIKSIEINLGFYKENEHTMSSFEKRYISYNLYIKEMTLKIKNFSMYQFKKQLRNVDIINNTILGRGSFFWHNII